VLGRRRSMKEGFTGLIGLLTCGGAVVAAALQEPQLLHILSASDQPIHVVRVRLAAQPAARGSLLVEITNASPRRAWRVEFAVAPADCPRADHPLATLLAYPRNTLPGNQPLPVDALDPGTGTTLLLPESRYREILAYQRKAGCADAVLPELTLLTVAFCDGSGWEGFADGPDHAIWSGRPWTPPSKPTCRASS